MNNDLHVILAHVGAGKHSISNSSHFKKLLKKSISKGLKILQSESDQSSIRLYNYNHSIELPKTFLNSFSETSKVIESDVLTNTSVGSSLNSQGEVSNDAHVLVYHNSTKIFFGLTNIQKFKYGITRCLNFMAAKEIEPLSNSIGVTKSCLMVDPDICFDFFDDKPCENQSLVTDKSLKHFNHWSAVKKSYDHDDEMITDTIGVMVVDSKGTILNGVSSGGNALKPVGRVGCASILGASSYSMSSRDFPFFSHSVEQEKDASLYEISLMASGNGESIISSDLCRQCCLMVLADLHFKEDNDVSGSLARSITAVLGPEAYVGVAGVVRCGPHVEMIYAHTTEAFVLGVDSSSNSSTFEYVFSQKKSVLGLPVHSSLRMS